MNVDVRPTLTMAQMRPLHKEFVNVRSRLETFKLFPVTYIKKEVLACAGFFFAPNEAIGETDLCVCYNCGIKLFKWEHNGDPWSEHWKYNKECEYIQKNFESRPTIHQLSSISSSSSLHPPHRTHAPNITSTNAFAQAGPFRGPTYPSQPGTTIPQQIEVDTMPHSKQYLYSSVGSAGVSREQSSGLGQSKEEKNGKLYASIHDSNAISEPPSDAMPTNQPPAPPVENYSSTNTPNNLPRNMNEQAIFSAPYSANISSEKSYIPQDPGVRKLDFDSQDAHHQYPNANEGYTIRSIQPNHLQMVQYPAHQNAYSLPQSSHHYPQGHFHQPDSVASNSNQPYNQLYNQWSPKSREELVMYPENPVPVSENFFSYSPENRTHSRERLKSNDKDWNQERTYNQGFPTYSKQTNNTYPQAAPSIRPQMTQYWRGDHQYH